MYLQLLAAVTLILTKLDSAEVQAKKTFTVEEKAMRRAEMARRRRNLSEKRNEEVKVRTASQLCSNQRCLHLALYDNN